MLTVTCFMQTAFTIPYQIKAHVNLGRQIPSTFIPPSVVAQVSLKQLTFDREFTQTLLVHR